MTRSSPGHCSVRGRISSDEDAFAGALAMGDAHLLVLPVRCLAGVVSFVTCPFILRRYARDLQRAGTAGPDLPSRADKCAKVTPTSVNLVDNKVVLEDLDLPVCKEDPALKPWAERIALQCIPRTPTRRRMSSLASRSCPMTS